MKGRIALKLLYFALLIASSTLPKSFFLRWFSLLLLSASLFISLLIRYGEGILRLPDPREFYHYFSEERSGSLQRTSRIIKSASLGYNYAREIILDRILDVLASNTPSASKREIRRDPSRYVPRGPLLDLLEREEVKGEDYLSLLELALEEMDVGRRSR